MTTYLPDTNVLIDALNGKRGRRELLRRLVLAGNRLGCCDVTVAEIYSGMRAHEAPRTWYDTSRKIARQAGRLRFDWARQGVTLSLTDTLLAATALAYGLTLVTHDEKHFPMPELVRYPLPGETA